MSSSSYYYGLYREHLLKAEKHANRIKGVEYIKNELWKDTFHDVKAINYEIDELDVRVWEMIRQNETFNLIAQTTKDHYEKGMEADTNLNKALTGLNEEIKNLTYKRDCELSLSDHYYTLYRHALEREEEEARRAREAAFAAAAKALIKNRRSK